MTTPLDVPEMRAAALRSLSEALEAYRDCVPLNAVCVTFGGKPEGVAVELADVLIRIFDECAHRNIPLVPALAAKMAYNATRPYRPAGSWRNPTARWGDQQAEGSLGHSTTPPPPPYHMEGP